MTGDGMTSDATTHEVDRGMPGALRARLAADFEVVEPLSRPPIRALGLIPFAVLTLIAAPWWFGPRSDFARLGWTYAWGLSLTQSMVGLLMVAVALREAVPGRAWMPASLVAWFAVPIVLVVVVTLSTFDLSPIGVRGGGAIGAVIGAMCFAGSLATALPGTVLSAVLAARAYPTRPALTGLLGGLGAGMMADAGWRLFCHFSEPTHVLTGHLGGVLAAGLCGALVSRRLHARRNAI
jgi:hypothetical protein